MALNPRQNSNGYNEDPFGNSRDRRQGGAESQIPIRPDISQVSRRSPGLYHRTGGLTQRQYGGFSQARETLPTGLVDGFIKTCQRWELNREDQITLLGYQERSFEGEQLLLGALLPPSRDVPDRMKYVLGISLGLGMIYDENVEAERAWLRRPRVELGDLSALRFMLEGSMANLIMIFHSVRHERGL